MTSENEIDTPVTQQDGTPTEPIRILIVEDSPNINLLYDRGLPNVIFEKRFAINGKDGLLIYNDWHPDIIILDVMLPVMTGYSVLKTIREHMKDKSTMIIMSTSLSGKDDVTSLMKLGIQGYILKPFNVRDIGGRILKYYEKAHPQKAGAALFIYEKDTDDTAKSSFKAKLARKKEEDERLMKVEPDFLVDEFTETLTIESFCRAFDADNFDITVKAENNTLGKMNEILQIPNLYEKIIAKKKVDDFANDNKSLLYAWEQYRQADFARLTVTAQKRIKILNRLLLKSIYPDKIPDIKNA